MKNELFVLCVAMLAIGCGSSGDSFVSDEENSGEEALADLEELSESEAEEDDPDEVGSSEEQVKEEDLEETSEEVPVSGESNGSEAEEQEEDGLRVLEPSTSSSSSS